MEYLDGARLVGGLHHHLVGYAVVVAVDAEDCVVLVVGYVQQVLQNGHAKQVVHLQQQKIHTIII